MKDFIWCFGGLFQKIFVADNLAKIVDSVFSSHPPYNGAKVLIAIYAFAFQIYCDFAGYSNIARGLGKCMGFDIMINFNLPYFSTNPREFWRKWHISLSTWLKDYLYIPLGGNKNGIFATYRNLAITMVLGGFWHGAKWTFIIWGAYHGALLILHRIIEPFFPLRKSSNFVWEKIWFGVKVVIFFHLVCLGWLFFRASGIGQISEMLKAVFLNFQAVNFNISSVVFFLWFFIAVQVFQFIKNDQMAVYKTNFIFKTVFYLFCIYFMFIWGVSDAKPFIYFQF